MPMNSYIFTPSGEMWPAGSVNARVAAIEVGVDKKGEPALISASRWLSQNRPVEQMTWAPGEPQLIRDRLITNGGWIERAGATVFNLYRPPTIKRGDPSPAASKPWLDHLKRVYPDDGSHILNWLAHRVQRPGEKINHALVLGGEQGIGKDTLLEPVKRAIGPWNCQEVSPGQVMGRFNGFVKAVILRVSEARDLGDVNRYQFYDHSKTLIAAPPDVLRVDEKNLREYAVPNVCAVVITTNHKTDGIFLPPDDRRHYVAWSDLTKDDFDADYWTGLWSFYDTGGDRHVAAYLANLDISEFDPKAPPPKTPAFWAIVDANRPAEDAELADVIDQLGAPDAFTLKQVQRVADGMALRDDYGKVLPNTFAFWLSERRNRRGIPHRVEQCGYAPVRNDGATDGLWKVEGARQVIYARASLTPRDRFTAAAKVVGQSSR